MSFLPDWLQTWFAGLPFTAPLALLLLLLVPLAFLVLLLRRQRLEVGSLLLFRDLPQRTLFQNLQLEHLWHRWIYALMFVILALIAAGLSLPQPGQRHLIVLDDSASMAALNEDGETRWSRLQRLAASEVEASIALGRNVDVLRLTSLASLRSQRDSETGTGADGNSAVFASSDVRAEELVRLIEQAKVSELPIELDKRLASLGALAGSIGAGRVSFYTDRDLGEGARNSGGEVRWVNVADDLPPINLAITDVSEQRRTFDRGSRFTVQNLSPVPVSGVNLIARSVQNPVPLPLVENMVLAGNEARSFDVAQVLDRASVLGAGAIQVSVEYEGDMLDLDNRLWLVPPQRSRFSVLLASCLGGSPLFDRLSQSENLQVLQMGGVPSTLGELSATTGDPADDSEPGLVDIDGTLESRFDVVIYDRCPIAPLYEELETNAIVIDGLPAGTDGFASVGPADVVRVAWQAPGSRSPVLDGLRSLVGMPMPSQTVRPLPLTHQAVGLLSDLDPAFASAQSSSDIFAPSDLLQGFVAWAGMSVGFDEQSGEEIALDPDPNAPKMLFLGFDPHAACVNDPLNDNVDGIAIEEAVAASRNGPDDCLALRLMMVNALEWMRDEDQFVRQYFSTGESLGILPLAVREDTGDGDGSLEGEGASAATTQERLFVRDVVQGQSGSQRRIIAPLSGLTDANVPASSGEGVQAVRWQLLDQGLYDYVGSRADFSVSTALLNANESRLDTTPLVQGLEISGAEANASRQDLVALLLLILMALMVIELLYLLYRTARTRAAG